MTYRNTASFGKRQEYAAIAELLKRKLDVYMTLVDDQGIDCVIRGERGGKLDYLDIQIKACSKQCELQDAAFFAAMNIPNPRDNLWFIFYSEWLVKYWVINSMTLTREDMGIASQNKKGKDAGKWNINMARYSKVTNQVSANPKYSSYEDDAGFKQLEAWV